MNSTLSTFFFPRKLQVEQALEYSQVLTEGLQLECYSYVQSYTAVALMYTSWSEPQLFTLRGLLSNIHDMNNKGRTISELAQYLMAQSNRNLFCDPEHGGTSVEMIGVHGLILQSIYSLCKGQEVSLRTIQQEAATWIAKLLGAADSEVTVLRHKLDVLKEVGIEKYRTYASSAIQDNLLSVIQKGAASSLVEDRNPAGRSTGQKQKFVVSEEDGYSLKVYDRDLAVEKAQKAAAVTGQDGNAKLKELLKEMANNTGIKPLSQIPGNLQQALSELMLKFPHFTPVISFIQRRLALAGSGTEGKSVKISPILLRGPAGTGKTYFSQELAKVLGLYFVERDLSVTSEAFVISGMDPGWKNSKPGVVFEAIVEGPTANPLICLNEIDKGKQNGTSNSPVAALYSLLEPTSSSAFSDEFVPLKLRADNVVWVLTANEGFIPEPIKTRLEIFEIPEPTIEQCRQIATHVWSVICDREMPSGHGFSKVLSDSILDKIAKVSPREMRKQLTDAASAAAFDGRKYLEEADFEPYSLRTKKEELIAKQPIGFIS